MMPSALAVLDGSIWDAVKAGALYFAVVFIAGFVLGAIHIRWVAPRVGRRMAELMKAPLMLVVQRYRRDSKMLPIPTGKAYGIGSAKNSPLIPNAFSLDVPPLFAALCARARTC